MTFNSFCLDIHPKIEKLDELVFDRYKAAILETIREEYFADNYDAILRFELVRVLSKECILFQVSAFDIDLGEPEFDLEDLSCPSLATFFVMNFSRAHHRIEITKFHSENSLCEELWEITREQFPQDEEESSSEEYEEDENEPIIVFENYFLGYTMVLNKRKKVAAFWPQHSLFFLDPEDDIKKNYSAGLGRATIFKIEKTTDHVWFLPSLQTVDLRPSAQLA
jgi:hypothetical protein